MSKFGRMIQELRDDTKSQVEDIFNTIWSEMRLEMIESLYDAAKSQTMTDVYTERWLAVKDRAECMYVLKRFRNEVRERVMYSGEHVDEEYVPKPPTDEDGNLENVGFWLEFTTNYRGLTT